MSELEKRRAVYALGLRAIRYYVDTGLCVFCNADDEHGDPHEEHCNVGDLSGILVDEERRLEKAEQREKVDEMLASIQMDD